MEHIVIVGGGLAAHQSARSLLQARPDARVSMVSAEHHRPYDRPHLSKGFLAGDDVEPQLLAGADIHAHARLKLLHGRRAEAIDRTAARIRLDNGEALGYDRLILATGSRVRQLPADQVRAPVHYLRTFDEALAIRAKLVEGAAVVIVGGGFIGLEVAAAARQRGCRVTVIEPRQHLLARTGSAALSQWIEALHRAHGVDIQLGTQVLNIGQADGGKARVDTSAGAILADIVIVGIGVQPNVELAAGCGLSVDDGILVDVACTTSDPGIFAAGEVTRYPVAHLGVTTRSESWSAASDQGCVAGRAAAGETDATYSEMPWLWSDQYHSSVQCIGLTHLACTYSFIGEPGSAQWLALGWSGQSQLVCAIAANRGRDLSAIRRALKRNEALPDVYLSTIASAVANPF
ncbi:NAD(P)/FAD-dependent oxidoreductase [Pseudomonas sp. NPDC089422]|uniref:NAD(P)/FAD-dependent oxidoreductase n=1 Tax=Pseudomonas sp. NPDC089422 TaxID=3364466 RepID=UPI00380D0C87